MSLFDDFLNSKIVVVCRTNDELRDFIFMLDGAEVRWASGHRASDYIPYSSVDVLLVMPPPDLGNSRGRLYTTSYDWAEKNGLSVVKGFDIIEEQSSKTIPSPLSLLFTKEVSNEPA